MDWNNDKSVRLTAVFTVLFALILLSADILGFIWMPWYVSVSAIEEKHLSLLALTIYSASIFAWICLYAMFRLLREIGAGQVFTERNTLMLRIISWCCACAAGVCALSALYYLPFAFVAAAAGFMALIVRIVKNAFEQAIAMKDELDLTI